VNQETPDADVRVVGAVKVATPRRILMVALVAGVLGAAASLLSSGLGPLWRSESSQRVLQGAIDAAAPAPPHGVTVARRGSVIPTLVLPALDGASVQLPQAYAGRPMLINFWASWCQPCIEEMPELNRYSSQQGSAGVQVIGIALDDPVAVEAFLHRIPVRYPILLNSAGPADSSVRLGNSRGVLPYSVLVGPDGRVRKQRIGPFDPGEIDDWATP